MAKTPLRRLKVFQTRLGFYDTVVAALSQAAALRAWGIHQNLFADGRAHVTGDSQAVEAALAHPETPLKRAVGSADIFALEAAHLPEAPDAPIRKSASKPSPTAKPATLRRPAADRSALDDAEAALGRLDAERKLDEATFRRRQDELDEEREAAQTAYVKHRKSAVAAADKARLAYRKAGGEE